MLVPNEWIKIGKRIGVEYAQEDANLPYRFWLSWEDSKKIRQKFNEPPEV
jgi:3-methyladenine DNA glycosylase Mpg